MEVFLRPPSQASEMLPNPGARRPLRAVVPPAVRGPRGPLLPRPQMVRMGPVGILRGGSRESERLRIRFPFEPTILEVLGAQSLGSWWSAVS